MKKIPSSMTDIKIDNINMIFELIRINDEITRVKLADSTDITSMSVTRIVNLLLDNKLIYEEGEILSGRGRPAKKLYINPSAFYSATAYLDVDEIKIAIINLENSIVEHNTIISKEIYSMKEYVDAVYSCISEMENAILDKISVISFVCPGIINSKSGEVMVSAQLKWIHEKLGEYAFFKFGKKIIVANDVKSALMGEICEIKETESLDLAYLDIGYGVGVGVISDGKLLKGANSNAGEIGHITIDYKGEKCECGRIGCLNTVLNIRAILERARIEDNGIECVRDIAEHYRENKSWAIELVDDICMYFAIALNNIIYAYDPRTILLGGKLFNQFDDILKIILASKPYMLHNHYWSDVQIKLSEKGENAQLIGGAIQAQKWFFDKLFS